jgi:phosphoribosylamine--glycine ligase
VNIIPYKEFTDFEEAIGYVRANPSRYVIKPSGEAQNVKRRLFVGEEEDGGDVLRVLESYKRVLSAAIPVFQLQKRVTGVEVAVGAFFNGHRFVEPININFEHKKLFPGNLGPSTGEMGTAMFWSPPNKLFNQTLKKMERVLARERFTGYVDLNCIVNANGIYPLEFTSRFGYPTIFIQEEGMITPMSELLAGLADGSLDRFKTKSGFQIGVRVIVPPYPFDDEKTFEEISKEAVVFFKKGTPEEVHIEDVKLVDGQWLVAGTAGVVLTVVGLGPTMRQAKAAAYARVKNILIPNMYYRDDIGDRWSEDSDRLHNWGYLREA